MNWELKDMPTPGDISGIKKHLPACGESDVRAPMVQARSVERRYDRDVYNVVRARIRGRNQRNAPPRAHLPATSRLGYASPGGPPAQAATKPGFQTSRAVLIRTRGFQIELSEGVSTHLKERTSLSKPSPPAAPYPAI